MAWFGSAYFDGSGGADAHTLVVAGGVSSNNKWEEFDAAWLAALEAHGVTPPFHMREFVRSRDGVFSRDNGWTNRRRVALMTALVDAILEHVEYTFSSAVVRADYALVDRDFRLHEFAQPYTLCANQVLYKLGAWKRMNRIDEPETFVAFESGDARQGQFIQSVRSKGIGATSIATAGKAEHVPFQFADVLAYEHVKIWRDAVEGRLTAPENVRVSLQRLEGSPDHDWGYHDARTLRRLCVDKGIRKRESNC